MSKRDILLKDLKRVLMQLAKEGDALTLNRDYYLANTTYTRRDYEKVFDSFTDFKNALLSEYDKEVIESNVKLKKQTQKFQDINRIERKSFREHARLENGILELSQQIKNTLDRHNNKLLFFDTKHKETDNKNCGIVQFSDLHLNELIDIVNNVYNFDIASKRLKKFVLNVINIFSAYEVKNILIVFSGDLLNSDRRLDELLNQCTNRAKACVLSVYLLEQVIIHLNQFFNIQVISVMGNESRINDSMPMTDNLISNNYDYTIPAILKYGFKNAKGIKFGDIDKMETVVKVGNMNILCIHGYKSTEKIEQYISKVIGRYSAKGIIIHYVLLGHLHSARIGDTYARSSSLCGSNAYSDNALNLIGRASQNCYVVSDKNDIHGFKIDLQNVDGVKGYNYLTELEAYNPKSQSKTKSHTKIMEIVI